MTRPVAACVVVATVVGAFFIVSMTFWAAELEYYSARPSRQEFMDTLPMFAHQYGLIYDYGWLLLLLAVLWGGGLIVKRQRSLLSMVVYVAVIWDAAILWTLFTLFAFYLINQRLVVLL